MKFDIDVNSGLVDELENGDFAAFASDFDSCRNGFPKTITTNLGNGRPLVGKSHRRDADGDLMFIRYRQTDGIDLILYND